MAEHVVRAKNLFVRMAGFHRCDAGSEPCKKKKSLDFEIRAPFSDRVQGQPATAHS